MPGDEERQQTLEALLCARCRLPALHREHHHHHAVPVAYATPLGVSLPLLHLLQVLLQSLLLCLCLLLLLFVSLSLLPRLSLRCLFRRIWRMKRGSWTSSCGGTTTARRWLHGLGQHATLSFRPLPLKPSRGHGHARLAAAEALLDPLPWQGIAIAICHRVRLLGTGSGGLACH